VQAICLLEHMLILDWFCKEQERTWYSLRFLLSTHPVLLVCWIAGQLLCPQCAIHTYGDAVVHNMALLTTQICEHGALAR
jgi:hypothetical protein